MSSDLLVGWTLGLISSLLSGLFLFWIQSRRDIQKERLKQIQEDTRLARNWLENGRKESLRGFDLVGANLSGIDLSNADLEDVNFENARLWATNLRGANLRGANFRNTEINGIALSDSNLFAADFSGARIQNTEFIRVDLRKANFAKVKKIENCVWNEVIIDDTTKLSDKLREEIQKHGTR